MEWLTWVHGSAQATSEKAAFGPGDEVRVWFKILDQGKERLGQFEGTVIRSRGSQASRTFTVRRLTHGEGVERVFPVDAKTVTKVDVLRRGKVRRARLYFLRKAVGKTRIAADQGKLIQAGETSPATQPAASLGASPEQSRRTSNGTSHVPDNPEVAVVAAEPPASVAPQP
jgi:large subunit ribosomal protein L19